MKCLQCKDGKMELTTYYPKTKKNMYYVREKAILTCGTCGHKERFV